MHFTMLQENRLLLVEDDLAVREAVTRVLQAEDYQVSSAASCAEAIHRFHETTVDVVLLDLTLGTEDGWQVFDVLNKLRPAVPIIVASAQPNRLAHPSTTRAHGVLAKPFEIAALLQALRAAPQAEKPLSNTTGSDSTRLRGSFSRVFIFRLPYWGARLWKRLKSAAL